MIARMTNLQYSNLAARSAGAVSTRYIHATLARVPVARADARAAAEKAITYAIPPEPEDARLTGATRSLYRRLLALNLPGSPPRTSFFEHPKVA